MGGELQISFISDQRKQQDQPTNSSVPETAYQSEWQNEKNWNNHIWEKVNTINMQQFKNVTIIKGVINWKSTIPFVNQRTTYNKIILQVSELKTLPLV